MNDSFSYYIPGQSSQKFQTDGGGVSLTGGWVSVVPSVGSAAPSGFSLFSFYHGGVTESEASVPAVPPSAAFRLYAETSGDFSHGAVGAMQSGVAVANTSANPATVTLELFNSDGSSTGLMGTLQVPAMGQTSSFLNQIEGFGSLQTPFKGALRVSSAAPISVVGIRGRLNERLDFLATVTPSVDEATPPLSGSLYFPQVVDGGGYTIQFILFSGQPHLSSSGR